MISDEELKVQGIRALIAALGDVQAGRFVSLLTRAPFDYTKWQASLWLEVGVEEPSGEAMAATTRTKTVEYDVAEQLRTPEEMAAYLGAWFQEAPGDAAGISRALDDIARACGIAQVAPDAGPDHEDTPSWPSPPTGG